MGLNINFCNDSTSDKTPSQQLEEAMAALGFVRKTTAISVVMREVQAESIKEPSKGDDGPARPEPGPDTRGAMNVGLEHAEHDAEAERARKEEVRAKNARNLVGTAPPVERGPDPDYTHPSGRKFGSRRGVGFPCPEEAQRGHRLFELLRRGFVGRGIIAEVYVETHRNFLLVDDFPDRSPQAHQRRLQSLVDRIFNAANAYEAVALLADVGDALRHLIHVFGAEAHLAKPKIICWREGDGFRCRGKLR